MTKEFVDYKTALALKELGFDEPCFATYSGETLDLKIQIQSDDYFTSVPLKQQAFRWFREKHNLWVEVKVEDSVKLGTQLYYWLIFGAYKSYEGNDWIRALYESNNKYSTYEEAEQACLDKLIEICKNK